MNHESGYERAHRQAEHIFRNLLPAHGMAVREGQIALCHAMPPAAPAGREEASINESANAAYNRTAKQKRLPAKEKGIRR